MGIEESYSSAVPSPDGENGELKQAVRSYTEGVKGPEDGEANLAAAYEASLEENIEQLKKVGFSQEEAEKLTKEASDRAYRKVMERRGD